MLLYQLGFVEKEARLSQIKKKKEWRLELAENCITSLCALARYEGKKSKHCLTSLFTIKWLGRVACYIAG